MSQVRPTLHAMLVVLRIYWAIVLAAFVVGYAFVAAGLAGVLPPFSDSVGMLISMLFLAGTFFGVMSALAAVPLTALALLAARPRGRWAAVVLALAVLGGLLALCAGALALGQQDALARLPYAATNAFMASPAAPVLMLGGLPLTAALALFALRRPA